MSQDSEGERGAAAWHAQRDAVAKRNVEARKRGRAERKSREVAVEVRERAMAARELHELEALNAAISKRRG